MREFHAFILEKVLHCSLINIHAATEENSEVEKEASIQFWTKNIMYVHRMTLRLY
jgi:hypothetical protein